MPWWWMLIWPRPEFGSRALDLYGWSKQATLSVVFRSKQMDTSWSEEKYERINARCVLSSKGRGWVFGDPDNNRCSMLGTAAQFTHTARLNPSDSRDKMAPPYPQSLHFKKELCQGRFVWFALSCAVIETPPSNPQWVLDSKRSAFYRSSSGMLPGVSVLHHITAEMNAMR